MSEAPAGGAVLEARDVTKLYRKGAGKAKHEAALDGVSVAIKSGETLGIVGESGSGKTTLSRLILGIERPTTGTILFKGIPLDQLDGTQRQTYRRTVAAVFQNPYSSLDPRMRIWQLITEQLFIERLLSRNQRIARAADLLQTVGLDPNMAERYPHQLSGGQRQRLAIARALVSNPKVLILDEPLSALDVSVRAQIVNLLLDLQDSMGLTYVFIAHDLTMVQHLCHWTIVMHRGKIVEEGPPTGIFAHPAHPYTAALIEASYLDRAQTNGHPAA
jgi:ABC-type oligopeptide transport system ATPase subunit